MSAKVIATAILFLGVTCQGLAGEAKETPSQKTATVHKVAYQSNATKTPRVSKAAFAVQYAALAEPAAGPREVRIRSTEEEFTRNSCCP